MKPLGKLFINNNSYYYYDTNKNEILSIDKELFLDIKRLFEEGIDEYLIDESHVCYDDINNLLDKGYLQPSPVRVIKNHNDSYIGFLLQRCISYLQLQVTQNCNFICRYCEYANDNRINRVHNPQFMSLDMAKKGIDFLFNHSKDAPEINISFYGGEPLLNINVIKKAVLYSENKFFTRKPQYFITTNASLMNEQTIDFFVNYNFHLLISLDGGSYLQNKHRKYRVNGADTFEDVWKNVRLIIDKYPTYFISNVMFNPVVFADEHYEDVINFFASKGIGKNQIRKQFASMEGVNYIYSGYNTKNNGGSNNIFNENYVKEQINSISLNEIDSSMISRTWHHNGPCIPGVQKLFLNANGEFFPCEKCPEISSMCIGDIEDGLDINKIKILANIGKISENRCKNCWAMRFCRLCELYCVDLENNIITSDVKDKNCDKQLQVFEEFLRRSQFDI